MGQGKQHDLLFSDALITTDVFWVNNEPENFPFTCTAKVRYRQADQACTVHKVGEHYNVVFEEPQRAVTPGQSIVFYQDDICLGGGVIESTEKYFKDNAKA